jgi:DNA-binding transcriptional LysR family regulator
MRWIGPADAAAPRPRRRGEPLPLVVLDAPCLLRRAAIDALDRAVIAWRIAFTSASLAGTWAAVTAGLGVSVRTPLGLPAGVRALTAKEAGLPALPMLGLALHRAEVEPAPAVARLAEILVRKLSASLTQ